MYKFLQAVHLSSNLMAMSMMNNLLHYSKNFYWVTPSAKEIINLAGRNFKNHLIQFVKKHSCKSSATEMP